VTAGPVQLVIDPATGEPVKELPNQAGERCAWAGAHVVALAPVPSDLPPPMVLVAARASGRLPATGPPSAV